MGMKQNTIDTDTLEANGYSQIIGYLENLLIRQLEKVRKYDLDGAVVLAEEANEIAFTLARSKALDRPEFTKQRRQIHALYRDIGLIIASERQEVGEKLQAVRKGLRVLGVYSGSV